MDLGNFGARYLLDHRDTQGRVPIIEHWVPPLTLAAPLHRHSREDEYSFVVKGCMGAFINGKPIEAEAGDFVFKARDDWHTFWNPGGGRMPPARDNLTRWL